MQKSVYSLVLSDGVVAQIDRLAYRHNTNRSSMINRILAEYVSYITPEKRMEDTFRQIESMLGMHETFRALSQPTDTTYSIRSAIRYKYNPTVRYSVELYKNSDEEIGELRVSLRSQNTSLLVCMARFFALWIQTELRYLGDCDYGEEGVFARRLRLRATDGKPHKIELSSEALGALLYAYIDVYDRSLQCYLAEINDPTNAAEEIDRMYRQYLKENTIIV